MEELYKDLREEVEPLLAERRFEVIKQILSASNAQDIAELITHQPPKEQVLLFRLLAKELAVDVFEHLSSPDQQHLLQSFQDSKVKDILEEMSPDDLARLLDEVPAVVAKRLVQLLPPQERKNTSTLLGYPENTAGRIMTPEYVALKREMTVAEALDKIRRVGLEKETVYYCYVVDEKRRLVGIVSLKTLVIKPPASIIGDIMDSDVISVRTEDDQEKVARSLQKYDLLAVPVVDKEDRLVGIITVDDVMDVMEEEVTEDIYRMGGVEVPDTGYFKARVFSVVGRRVGWLLILLITNTLTGNIIIGQSDTLKSVVALAAFIPLLIGSGGNIGAQSSTVMVRGLALREVSARNYWGLLSREVGIGCLLGVMLGMIVTIWAHWLQGNWLVSLTVGLSLVVISTLASLAGGMLPFVFSRLKLDPAIMSAPFITTMVDVLGVFTYFQVARFILFK
ncbi:MAG: magnesium transporter [Thermodesulfobacteriota bacterium]